jgi:hypothetical protein
MRTKKTPSQWAKAKGHVWQLAVTTTVHGWHVHAHDAGAEIELTEEQYDGAVAAACCETGEPRIYEPALSPYAPPTKLGSAPLPESPKQLEADRPEQENDQ